MSWRDRKTVGAHGLSELIEEIILQSAAAHVTHSTGAATEQNEIFSTSGARLAVPRRADRCRLVPVRAGKCTGKWWALQGLNLRPLPCEGNALPLS